MTDEPFVLVTAHGTKFFPGRVEADLLKYLDEIKEHSLGVVSANAPLAPHEYQHAQGCPAYDPEGVNADIRKQLRKQIKEDTCKHQTK